MKRRLPLTFVVIVTVICVLGASVAAVASGAHVGAVAYSVNGTKVSQATVDAELKALADSKAVKASVKQGGTSVRSDGSIDATLAANVLTQRIALQLLRDEASRRDVKVTEAQRTTQRDQLQQQIAGLPKGVQDTAVDLNAHVTALGFDSAAASAFFAKAFRTANVKVDPRYGRWNPKQGVCPPAGCATSAASGG